MNSWGHLAYIRVVFLGLLLSGSFFLSFVSSAQAATIQQYKDTLTNSAPTAYSNHTIEFKTTVAIPAGGFVRFTPDDGDFTIPPVTLDFDSENVELAVATSSGYHYRLASSTQSDSEDGIAITSGTSGQIEVDLNTTNGIPANAYVRLRIGNNTTYSTSTDLGIVNPTATGTHGFRIETGSGGTVLGQARGLVAIVENVSVGPIDTHEFNPPNRFNGAPSGTISGTTQVVQVSLETNEFAKCRYTNATDTPYFSMGNEFGSRFQIVHSINFSVATGTTYTLFVRCIDDEGNVNTDDYIISFTVPQFPIGEPGPSGDGQGTGSGTGSGSGTADPGAGDPEGGDATSGGAASGGGGGGGGGGGTGISSGGNSGGGGLEGTAKPYQSGDGTVIINGYAFPRSTVSVLVDGSAVDTATADTGGKFSITIDAIARGVYTFGVYAVDKQGVRSSTFSTTFTVTGSRVSTLSNINVMPSIKVSPDPVTPGQQLLVTGFSIPEAVITVENQMDKSPGSLKTLTTNSDVSGAWSMTIDTASFQKGTYKIRAKSKQETGDMVQTNFSGYTFYGVGQAAAVARSSDLNRDGKVNLIDFSILLYWWNSDGGNSNPPADINADGKVSLTDFSIMIFNWTG